MKTRVADYIAQKLQAIGCDTAFMLSGGMMMHTMDAIGRRNFRYFCHHHEQASAMAADGYARETGRLGLCLVTSGPGATNILTGLVGSYQDSVPVLFITGQCKRRETVRGRKIPGLRQCGFLEVDIIPMVESVTKYAVFVDEPESIRYHLEKAIHLATTGRPGPVLLDIPLDVQGASIDPDTLPGFNPPSREAGVFIPDLERVIDAIYGAERPLVVAGHGVRSAGMVDLFRRVIDVWQVPVATTQMAKDLLPYEHPLFVGHPGPRANRGANFCAQLADVIVCMGSSLHIQTVGYEGELFAPTALKIQLDLDAALLEREHVGANWKFGWDLQEYLPMMAKRVTRPWGQAMGSRWRAAGPRWKAKYASRNEAHVWGEPSDRVNLYEFANALSDQLTGSESILTDAGQPHPILGQAFLPSEGQRYLNPGSFAEMGYALPASIGVAAAAPHKQVISVIGDGSLQTNVHELQTLVHHGFNIKTFVINNDGYGSIRNTQKSFFAGFYVASTPSTGVSLPDTEKLCTAYGVKYVKCANRSELHDAIARTLREPGPVLCEVMAVIDQRILPVVPSELQVDGSIKSKALHEMVPAVDVTLAHLRAELGGESEPLAAPVGAGAQVISGLGHTMIAVTAT